MITIKEMSKLTGVSARTLRYYDEIGLFHPAGKSNAGYRLYDETTMKELQQILFFRDLDVPLKIIKKIIDNPALDRTKILLAQKKMLIAEKERKERLILSIDNALKGVNTMDFAVFSKEETEGLFQSMLENMPEKMRDTAVNEFGSVEEWKKHYVEAVSSEKIQKMYAKVVEWYGGKEDYISSVKNPISKKVALSYQKRIENILEKLSAKRKCNLDCFEVRELIGEYGFVLKQLLQLKEEKGMMLTQARFYREKKIQEKTDEQYGQGFSEFLACAIESFYTRD